MSKIACLLAVATLFMTGAGEVQRANFEPEVASVPAWIPLPAGAEVTLVSHANTPVETGSVLISLDRQARPEFDAIIAEFRARHYEVEDNLGSADLFLGAASAALAADPATGRKVQIVAYKGHDGGLMRLSYVNPPERQARAGF